MFPPVGKNIVAINAIVRTKTILNPLSSLTLNDIIDAKSCCKGQKVTYIIVLT